MSGRSHGGGRPMPVPGAWMPRLSPSAHVADRKLVKGLNEGDEAALAALYDEYGERIHDYVLSMSGDEKIAADIVHDTFIDAARRAPRMRDHLQLGSWLYGAARRRCVRRGRVKILFWDRSAEFSDVPFLSRGEPEGPVPDWPPSDELHGLLRASLARLEPVDQEVSLLAFRHGLRPSRLGAALGLSPRRAALRIRRARTELEAALQKEVDRANRACAVSGASDASGATASSGEREDARSTAVAVLAARPPTRGDQEEPLDPPPPDRPLRRFPRRRAEAAPADPATERHAAGCPACVRRGRVTAAALLGRAPAPMLPAALRHRVMHTATDPELAGYRADIAARGGALTPAGLPSQPDVPSAFTRRWLVTGAVMAAALAAAIVAVLMMSPGIGAWPPFRPAPQPDVTHERPPDAQGRGGDPTGGPGGGGGGTPGHPGQPPVVPQTDDRTKNPSHSPRPPSSQAPAGPGTLVVNPAKVEMYGTKTAQVTLAARSGPVTWTAVTSTNQLALSETRGDMSADGTATLTLTLRTAIIGLPGKGSLTFTDSEGARHTVNVVWGTTIL
ncbi:sigma-70 family RNA polymerase sigma factor [Actinomadura decatromicini]|uniref:Sigma-70 family RNA polymerase sigma factor n=1 Tax=Actinomadura decatromicini TaxID=2604572 RepID=A0A5D3FR59_9ACTN|nr:sigma-70 family RNA polymerase sigma factor [Actinomadura decatromicini]